MTIKHYFNDFAALFFPPACVGCRTTLITGEQIFCTQCWYHLPFTNFHTDPENRSAKRLWGRANLRGVTSYLYFREHSRVQHMIHQLKYRNRPDIAVLLGRKYGQLLRHTTPFSEADYIIPIPLHRRKLLRRGYNQSSCFAYGLADSMQIPVIEQAVIRRRHTPSQTKKNRYQRIENIRGAFAVAKPEALSGKHLLLVDDVLTTGATIEACADALLQDRSISISAVTIAHTI